MQFSQIGIQRPEQSSEHFVGKVEPELQAPLSAQQTELTTSSESWNRAAQSCAGADAPAAAVLSQHIVSPSAQCVGYTPAAPHSGSPGLQPYCGGAPTLRGAVAVARILLAVECWSAKKLTTSGMCVVSSSEQPSSSMYTAAAAFVVGTARRSSAESQPS